MPHTLRYFAPLQHDKKRLFSEQLYFKFEDLYYSIFYLPI